MDLTKLDTSEEWNCQNKTVLHTYNVSISASVTDDNNTVYTGPWSRSISVQPPCSVDTPLALIVGIVIPVVLVIIILVLILLRTLKWAKRKKDLFTRLGKVGVEQAII